MDIRLRLLMEKALSTARHLKDADLVIRVKVRAGGIRDVRITREEALPAD